ncbi:RrF2 family transcriptional regulator [Negadavirga shengliensis]|uniref:RrF2 family transcriptional regulator n=1 Tax=Negadavirga shengliensis TaxID=1389218 RepID=A0ABV9SYZ0_9BACT
MKVLSQTSKYGIRAMLYMISHPAPSQFISIGEISKELGLSFHFLTKIFRELTSKGLLHSYRGPAGGVALAKPADEIRLLDIALALEGEDYFDQCLLGLPGCGEEKPCPVHAYWKDLKGGFYHHLAATSIGELAEKVTKEEVRI